VYRPRELYKWSRSDARSFLNEVVYRDASPPIRAVGFKLFYQHGRTDGAGNPWPVIRERKDVKLIHLVRQNPIASFLSNELIQQHLPYVRMRSAAGSTSQATSVEQAQEQPPIVVDVDKFKDYLAQYGNDIAVFTKEFADHDILELSYEALSSRMAESLTSVLDFLGVDRRELRVQTERQSKGNVMKRIANLNEVAAAHRGTRWEDVPRQW
jgi:hypothetical protein